MLSEVEQQIRKDIPRLIKPTIGYDVSSSIIGSYEVLKEIIINTAIKMYKVYLSDKKPYLRKKDEEL